MRKSSRALALFLVLLGPAAALMAADSQAAATREFVDRWTNDLSEQQVALIEHLAGARMEELGYARVGREQPDLPSGWKIRGDRMRGMAEQAYRYARYRPRYLAFLLYRKARLGLLKSFLWSVNY